MSSQPQPIQSLFLLLNAACLAEMQQQTPILLNGLNRPWMEPTVYYYTQDEKVHYYTIDMVLFHFDLLEFKKNLL